MSATADGYRSAVLLPQPDCTTRRQCIRWTSKRDVSEKIRDAPKAAVEAVKQAAAGHRTGPPLAHI